ncbi:monofunctional biosynthetic peptidoglycan transglycosylase [Neptunomonas antarctica]|uniref:Biosynthetic peptidoglycan transglycosylase n=1 Tax=Neptunomonas antarctica TaxID=619304 RepID=A0A1N7ISX7_9GAMM|nr:monofunctional biosynthetic peptidoglycan transglycosylase [Neptunomonas antarctica]SIS40116.1 monofunctional biosynthetic peptidoglycan transglycosylase [Neptunomonas antarctica]
MAKRSILQRFWYRFCIGIVGLCVLILAIVGSLRFIDPPTSAFIIVDQWQHPGRSVQQSWVDLENISPWMPLAVIASEDQTFLQHWGLDIDAIVAVIKDYRKGDSLRGASTISQQTVKNLFLWNGHHFIRKVVEAGLTLSMECFLPKRRIMEIYLNIAEFGEGIYGVEAASRHFFGISARQLTQSQAARLAAVLPNPKRFNVGLPTAYISQRVSWITRQMRQLGGVAFVRPLFKKDSA